MSVQEACSGPEFVPGVLRGYRSWSRDGAVLRGNFGKPWETDTLTATCQHADHAPPAADCTCGIYAYYKPSAVYLAEVFGVVEASGRVLMGEYGFRAEQARIVALVAREPELGAGFGNVAIFPSREALLAEFPPDDVSALVGDVPDGAPPITLKFDVTLDASALVGVMNTFGVAIQQAMKAQIEAFSALHPVLTQCGLLEEELPADPRQRALELRKRRNTGPAVGRFRLDGTRR